MSTENDRVRNNTAGSTNRNVDQELSNSVKSYANRSPQDIAGRIDELEREWDVERFLEMNASAIAFTGLVLGVTTRSEKWLFVSDIVLTFLFQHAVQGWCPPLPLLRKLGVRSREELDREKYALKALRGDFETDMAPHEAERATREETARPQPFR